MKVKALFFVWAFTTLCLVSYTAAFSHGASLSACADMKPKHIRAHLQDPQNSYITIHTNMSFFPGDKIPVTVRSTRDFMGFMLQARRMSNDQIAGTFVYIPPGSKLLACFEDGDTVTHSEKSLKRNLSFVWKAPDQPVGDVRFFLSVVQSYFIYWARIQSSIVSQQIQNRTTAESGVALNAIKPTPLQISNGLKRALPSNKENLIPDIRLTQFSRSTLSSLARITATLILDPAYKERDIFVSVSPDNGRFLPESLVESVTSHAIRSSGGKQVNGSGMDDDLTLESSLQFQNLSLIAQDYSSHQSSYDGTVDNSTLPKPQLCLTCKDSMEGASAKSSPTIAASISIHLWEHVLFSSKRNPPEHLAGEENPGLYQSLSAASRQMAEKQAMPQNVSANFLPQAEATTTGQEKWWGKDTSENSLLKVTRTIPKTAVSGREGGNKPKKESHLVATQLGVLLGGSAILGMILAIGLRCIHSQYCHKRTEVSFGEPDNNVIVLQESGEMMHFRKIRENSFVLVQAEYNWISPSVNGIKAVG